MKVTVVWATPAIQDLVEVDVAAGATIADALAQSGLAARYRFEAAAIEFAIFGRRARADAAVAHGDRIELTRALQADPKAARARRARAEPLPKSPRRIKRPPPR